MDNHADNNTFKPKGIHGNDPPKGTKKFKPTSIKLDELEQSQSYFCPSCDSVITNVIVRRRDEPNQNIREIRRSIHGAPVAKKADSPPEAWSEVPRIKMRLQQKIRIIMCELLKVVVHVGLTELITSLGIVTSAASADAATLNIIALALANLLGRSFILTHNLWEFKDELSRTTYGQQMALYGEAVVGTRQYFFLHASIAILSFFVFGLVPPLVYGFSFLQSNDKDLKLSAVLIASLVCIALLALAKARHQMPHKYIKTVTLYIGLGFGVSCVSYLAGNWFHKLLERFYIYI